MNKSKSELDLETQDKKPDSMAEKFLQWDGIQDQIKKTDKLAPPGGYLLLSACLRGILFDHWVKTGETASNCLTYLKSRTITSLTIGHNFNTELFLGIFSRHSFNEIIVFYIDTIRPRPERREIIPLLVSDQPQLTTLHIHGSKIGLDEIKSLASQNKLTHLGFTYCHRVEIEWLGLLLKNYFLKTLDLVANEYYEDGKRCFQHEKIAAALAGNSPLTELNLWNNKIFDWGLIALAALNQTIKKLTLTYQSDMNWLSLSFFLGNQSLTSFQLQGGEDCPKKLKNIPLFTLLSKICARNLIFQKNYDETVNGELLILLPKVIVRIVEDYSKGDYPFSFKLFHQALGKSDKNRLKKALPKIKENLPEIRNLRKGY